MLDLHIITSGQSVTLYDLPAVLGRRKAAQEIGDTIEGLIAFADELGGDSDLEPNGDERDDDGDGADVSWTEWHTRGKHKGLVETCVNEDDEDDGDAQDGNHSEDDFMHHGWSATAGCPIADPGGCEHDGQEPDDGY